MVGGSSPPVGAHFYFFIIVNLKMDSENSDDGFARGKGEALEMGEDFDDSEEYDQQISDQEPPVP